MSRVGAMSHADRETDQTWKASTSLLLEQEKVLWMMQNPFEEMVDMFRVPLLFDSPNPAVKAMVQVEADVGNKSSLSPSTERFKRPAIIVVLSFRLRSWKLR